MGLDVLDVLGDVELLDLDGADCRIAMLPIKIADGERSPQCVVGVRDDVGLMMSLAGDQSVGEKIVERCRRLQSWIAYCRRALTPGSGVFVKTSSWLEVRGSR